ncbi:hypothetical protein [uncultured Dubosiella sp.]|uniref:type III-A CRISPR-associated RAMP protein Csm4 n=1 Tax=uncultured Dubosiella sp. TaxID=1937011 RepID=UPI002731F06F|nr:hypothetical protein [uncultured Dubosiella sp.]
MKTYRFIFRPVSILNQIPDAQTIFGALCGTIKKRDGEEKLNKYLNSLKTDKPWFIHSSMFPDGLFPFLSENLFPLEFVYRFVQNQSAEQKLIVLSEFKKYKRLKYISFGILNEYVLSGKVRQLQKDLLAKPERFSIVEERGILRQSHETTNFQSMTVLSTRNGTRTDSLDKDLFYNTQIFVPEEQKFQILVKTNQAIEKIKLYFSLLEYTGIGARRSVGMNQFHLEQVEELHCQKQNESAYLLSKCIPEENEFDFSQSYYRVDSKLFRGAKTYVYGDYVGRFTRLLEGSICQPTKEKEYYGKMISTVVDGKTIDHYGIGMVV